MFCIYVCVFQIAPGFMGAKPIAEMGHHHPKWIRDPPSAKTTPFPAPGSLLEENVMLSTKDSLLMISQ